jgi:hypothetical protein
MADDQMKPRLEVVGESTPPHANSIFDDLDQLRKASKITVQRKTVLVNVTVDKPANCVYFRAHPTWHLEDTTVIKDPDSGVYYFVNPPMRRHPKLAPRLRRVILGAIALWPADVVQIWPVPLPGLKSDFKAWQSARAAYELSRDCWVQMVWSDETSNYMIETAEGIDHQPIWPDKSFNELLKLGFADKIIDSEEHAYVRQLRGLTN